MLPQCLFPPLSWKFYRRDHNGNVCFPFFTVSLTHGIVRRRCKVKDSVNICCVSGWLLTESISVTCDYWASQSEEADRSVFSACILPPVSCFSLLCHEASPIKWEHGRLSPHYKLFSKYPKPLIDLFYINIYIYIFTTN